MGVCIYVDDGMIVILPHLSDTEAAASRVHMLHPMFLLGPESSATFTADFIAFWGESDVFNALIITLALATSNGVFSR
jgi:hypothetical protein